MKSLPWRRAVLTAAALAGSFGCSDVAIEGDESLGSDDSEIINGTVPADGSLQARGVVRITFTGGACTGTLVSNQYVLTARHCVRNWTGAAWGNLQTNISVRLEGPGNVDQVIAASTNIMESSGNPSAGDYALIQLVRPIVLNDTDNAFYNAIYTGTDASLLNQVALCIGYGNNAYATAMQNQTGGGTLRTANLTISNTSNSLLTVTPNATNQIVTSGDSGSTCFFGSSILGVQSGCSGTGTDINGNGVVESWEFSNITSCVYASPGGYRTWANNNLLATVSLPAFRFVPALPAGTTVNARVTSLNGTNSTGSATSARTVNAAAIRSGWWQVQVTTEPARMMCSKIRTTSPLGGNATAQGACVGDGVVAAML